MKKKTVRRNVARRLNDKEYSFIYSRVPRLCIDILIFTGDGLILTKRNISPYRGMWHFPGGGIRYGESIDGAMQRIIKTEIGVGVKRIALVGYFEALNQGKTFRHDVSIVFVGKITSGALRADEQATAIKSFKRIPKDIISHQGTFLRRHRREIEKITHFKIL